MGKSRVFVGPDNNAANATYIALALRQVGIKARSYAYKKHIFGYETDHVIPFLKVPTPNIFRRFFKIGFLVKTTNKIFKNLFFIYCLVRYNTFFFNTTSSFFADNTDLPVLKFFNKKIAFFFIGCPERDPTHNLNIENGGPCKICNDYNLQEVSWCTNLEKKRRRVQFIEKYATQIYADDDLRGFLKKPDKALRCFVTSFKHDHQNILAKFDNTEPIKIVHFPSNSILKGTKHVNATIEKLKQIYGDKIHYRSERVPNHVLLEILEESHIVLDEFNTGYGLLAIEAMSRGCVVIGRISDWFSKGRESLPIVNAEIKNIEKNLSWLIENPNELKKVAIESIEFFEKYHSMTSVGNIYVNSLNLK